MLCDLPVELIVEISKKLGVNDIILLRKVCKFLCEILDDEIRLSPSPNVYNLTFISPFSKIKIISKQRISIEFNGHKIRETPKVSMIGRGLFGIEVVNLYEIEKEKFRGYKWVDDDNDADLNINGSNICTKSTSSIKYFDNVCVRYSRIISPSFKEMLNKRRKLMIGDTKREYLASFINVRGIKMTESNDYSNYVAFFYERMFKNRKLTVIPTHIYTSYMID